jgi:TnpA family transposase
LQRKNYFSFSKNELQLIIKNKYKHVNLYTALQLGYFKAKKIFFQISWQDVSIADLNFIIQNYFENITIEQLPITKHQYYILRQEIIELFGYQSFLSNHQQMLEGQAINLIKRDISPSFIARVLLEFLNDIKVIRPSYTTLQSLVSLSLTKERIRINTILSTQLSVDAREQLAKLMTSDDSISSLAALKQDAKNFGFKMMLKERDKFTTLKPLYHIANQVITTLAISKLNIDHYANLLNYYSVHDLRKLKYNQHYLYILCYITQRYQQLNDNLVEAFIYHTKRFQKIIKEKVKVHFTALTSDSQTKIANLILLYVDDKYDDKTLFTKVKEQAFNIMPKEEIHHTAKNMLNKPALKRAFRWQEIDKLQKTYTKNLRPIFTKLTFASDDNNNPWLKSVKWIKDIFINNQKISDKPYSQCPKDTIPKYLEPYLLDYQDKEVKNIKGSRYEYLVYSHINKQLSHGGLYVPNSINHRLFNHELVTLEKQKEILNQQNIPWFAKPVEQKLSELTTELDDLWVKFNNLLKNDKLDHVKYNKDKQKLMWSKTKASRNDKLQNHFFKQIPSANISDLINFVNDDCNFLSAFIPLQPRYAKSQENNKDTLIATILAQAFSLGNYKMSQISDLSYKSLDTAFGQNLRLSTLKEANDLLSNAIAKLPIFPYYSLDLELLYSGLDGQKYELDTDNIIGRDSKKYHKEGKGVSAYTMLANHIPLQCKLIGTHEHESYYVFDIWYSNTSTIVPDVLTGDMHLINKANFAVTNWFGPQLQPRFTDLNAQLKHLYCASDIKQYDNFLVKPVSQLDLQIIRDQKAAIDQIVATLALKEMNQATLIKKLCNLSPANPLRKAVFEYDKLILSIYTLKYMINLNLQKTVHKSQNRIESYHQLRAAIAKVGGKKELYGKTDIDINISNQCGRLIANVIIYYNSIILSKILEKYEKSGDKKFLNLIKKISPIAWHHHIHFLGQYTFQNQNLSIDIDKFIENVEINI